MDKLAIKKYAVWARRELISRVSTKALQYGISEEDCGDSEAESVNGHLLTAVERKQRRALIAQIKEKGYTEVMEEVAYTWFNRFSALRFMEVNGYLPSHVRVFTDEENNFKPQIITEAIHLELDGLDMEKVYAFKEANQTDELYKYLLIVQCNALNPILLGMFQKIDDYTELLFPDNLLREGSVIEQMITMIPEEDWQDAVQIIGWLYQYYNAEKKDDVFAALKKNVKISKENIPAATQLFTPDWIVRYMVENSLGRLWLEGHPTNKDTLLPTAEEQSAYCAGNRESEDRKWHYYLEEAEQEPDVQAKLAEIRKEYATMKPEDIRCIDPCCGSGHILAYLFDVLVQIYEDYGYTTREAVSSIVENNIYGLDIDDRAAQLANFAVMMKARQYDRRFFSRGIQPKVYAIVESNNIEEYIVEYFVQGNSALKMALKTIINEMTDAKEYGSILNITAQNWTAICNRIDEIRNEANMFKDVVLTELVPLVQVAKILASKYDLVITNPPYMSSGGMAVKLSMFIKNNYPDARADLFAVCMQWGLRALKQNRFMAMITMESWMFLPVLESMRKQLLNTSTIQSMVHMPYLGKGGTSLGIAFGNGAFVLRKENFLDYIAHYECIRYYETDEEGKPFSFPNINERYGFRKQRDFLSISSAPVAYWASNNVFKDFRENRTLSNYIDARSGISTGANNRFYRCWFECSTQSIAFDPDDTPSNSEYKWFPIVRGGDFRKWYGNMESVLNLKNDGFEIRTSGNNYRLRTPSFYSKKGITWNRISSRDVSFRIKTRQVNFGENSPCMFVPEEQLLIMLGFLNSKVSKALLEFINSTMTFQVMDIQSIPYIPVKSSEVEKLVKENIELSKDDWDAFEHSWDFQIHPLIPRTNNNVNRSYLIKEYFFKWENICKERYEHLRTNEERINEIFIEAYGLQDILTNTVEDIDVTVSLADLKREIKSLISYAVGCMFGRYSLDRLGLVYAGGIWDSKYYKSFIADKDNIIPVCDDEYFDDDMTGQFVQFIETVYGKDTLDENLRFIADALDGRGQSRDIIRDYFMNGFYKDHCADYFVVSIGKRPIYWLFDSGKKGGFKALIYMHRYQPDTIARMRTDYVHEQQARYRTAIEGYEQRAAAASGAERVSLNKKLKTLREQSEELHGYEEKIHHLADQMISIDLDDGVKHNYAIFQDVLAKIK